MNSHPDLWWTSSRCDEAESLIHPTDPLPRSFPCSGWLRLLLIAALFPLSVLAADAPAVAVAESFRWSEFIGPFHVVLLHFPIGFVVATAVLEALACFKPAPGLNVAVRTMLWLTFLSGIVAVSTGLFRENGGGFSEEATDPHRNLALLFVGLTLAAAWTARAAGKNPEKKSLTLAYRSLLALAVAVIGPTGHLGGNLTHGSDFLTRGAPPLIRDLLEPSPSDSAPHRTPSSSSNTSRTSPPGGTNTATLAAGPTDAERFYLEKIAPVLESRCYSCHGPEKHKGDLRLDQRENVLRGGESGVPSVTPGDSMKSHLLRVVLLPRDHDDAMPPEGKPGLTPAEILNIAHWIQAGASFGPAKATPPAAPAAPPAAQP